MGPVADPRRERGRAEKIGMLHARVKLQPILLGESFRAARCFDDEKKNVKL
jgi:hypothetical protein